VANKKNYGMVIDTRVCVGCSACVYACKSENAVPEGYCRDWVVQETKGNFPKLTMENRSERCQHCENAPCVTYCPTRASHYAEDGTVQINRSLCTGCKACLAACPYDARYIHPDGFADKCSLCHHRIEQGLKPHAFRSARPEACTWLTSMTPTKRHRNSWQEGLSTGRKNMPAQDRAFSGFSASNKPGA